MRGSLAAACALAVIAMVAPRPGLAHDQRGLYGTAEPPLARDDRDPVSAVDRSADREGEMLEVEGTLHVVHEDRRDGARYRHYVTADDGTRVAIDGLTTDGDFLTGDRVRVRGRRSAGGVRIEAAPAATSQTRASVQLLAAAPLSNTLGVQTVAVILVNFSNDPSQPYTVDQVRSVFADVGDYWMENSYLQTSIAVDVFGWYTIQMTNQGCDTGTIEALAQQAATADGVRLGDYARRVYAFPFNTACPFSGAATIGGRPSSAWLNGGIFMAHVAHELGHNLGLYHSHALRCNGVALGVTCSAMEYGDTFDPMGQGSGHYNAFQKERLGWLNYGVSPPTTTVQAAGSYVLDGYETAGTGPKALRIARPGTGQSFYVELRTGTGAFAGSSTSGVVVHLTTDDDPNSSNLLDMTPATTAFSDGVLAPGDTFVDSSSGIGITSASVTSASAVIEVTVSSPCVRANPAVTTTPIQSPAVPSGTTVTFAVSVTNADSGACSASSFALDATAPGNWATSLAVSSVTLSPGATSFTTLQVTSPSVPAGSYTIAVSAANSAAPTSAASASAIYAVAPPATAPQSFADDFGRPDANALGNGWVVVAGDLMIRSGEARNASNAIVNAAVQPTLTGAGQTVAMSFASTKSNAAPRLGLLLRYQDPGNYYTCYRQVGASSRLVIARVQSGVETVLKSVAVPNPPPNQYSTLSCDASASTLTLRLGGVARLSTSDTRFGAGAVGYSIWSRHPASHRADNFAATVR